MRELESLRKIYHPFYPVGKMKPGTVSFTEFKPHISLYPYIFHYWELKTLQRLETCLSHKVVPNGCLDIYFEISSPNKSYITGLSNSASSVMLENEFHYIGICFMPTVVPQLYKLNSADLHNHHEDLSNVARTTSKYLSTSFYPEITLNEIKDLLDRHFMHEISRMTFKCDSRLLNALHTIFHSNGQLRVETDLDVGLSSRQLRRVFDIFVGDSPKSFAKTVRFQKCLQALSRMAESTSFYDFGYYDQVHYIREFKKLYGAPPSKIAHQ